MPWDIKKSGKGYVVVKKDGTVVGGNKTKLSKKRALAMQRALYANVKE